MSAAGGLLVALSLVLSAHGFTIPKADCVVNINADLTDPQPLVLIPGGSYDLFGFWQPSPNADLTFAAGQEVRLVCTGSNNYLTVAGTGANDVIATCSSGKDFIINGQTHTFSSLTCNGIPFHTARETGQTCYNGNTLIEIGFELGNEFWRTIQVCFDSTNLNSLYSEYWVVKGIGGYQSGYPRPDFIEGGFYPTVSASTVYSSATEVVTLGTILGDASLGSQYISGGDYFLARGHLAAKADFVYGSQHRSTFYYINVAPQWQTFNGANWNALEMSLRTYADNNQVDLQVFTGTYGIATLPNVDGVETELYLYIDANNNPYIKVPKLFWKAAYEPVSQRGVVFVGVNNPYVSPIPADFIICTDFSSQINYLSWDATNIQKGYSYVCEVDDFRQAVPELPAFTVSGLLV